TVALALAGSGYRPEARRIARFLAGLDLSAAARFAGDGDPVPGRGAQGDASGWVAAAARVARPLALSAPSAGSSPPASRRLSHSRRLPRRQRPDYQEGEPGNYLANAISSGQPLPPGFDTARGLVRRAGDPGSGLDSA